MRACRYLGAEGGGAPSDLCLQRSKGRNVLELKGLGQIGAVRELSTGLHRPYRASQEQCRFLWWLRGNVLYSNTLHVLSVLRLHHHILRLCAPGEKIQWFQRFLTFFRNGVVGGYSSRYNTRVRSSIGRLNVSSDGGI